ncbi:MAG: Ig-like domain-containing protein [Caldilineales bacterium]|nr:Ig-like domain-containing protein [Caldilineales bacterium]
MKNHRLLLIPFIILFLALFLAACGDSPTPTAETPTTMPPTDTPVAPTATPTVVPPTATPPPTAPQVLQTNPTRGEELAPDTAIVVRFDRPVDPASVELAFEPELEGEMTVDGSQVQFQPASYRPNQRYAMQLAASANGFETGPLSFEIITQGYLQVVNTTPGDGEQNALTDAPITIAFNRPVVPLGAPGDDPGLPQPLSLDPPATGSGNWLNTSLYQFQPDPPLLAGVSYSAVVTDVTDLGGSLLAEPYTFAFTTTLPVVAKIAPEGDRVAPTTPITITFSQPMDEASAEAALSVTVEDGSVITGDFSWLNGGRVLVMQPDSALPFGEVIMVNVSDAALSSGGQGGLRNPRRQSFTVAPLPQLLRTQPTDGAQNVTLENGVQFFFNTNILPETVEISVSPEISATQVYTWYDPEQSTFFLNFPFLPVTDYTIGMAAGVADPFGNTISEPASIHFRTGDRNPSLEIVKFGEVGTFSSYSQPEMLFRHTNIDQIDAELYRLTPDQFQSIQPEQDWERWNRYNPPAEQLVRAWSLPVTGERNTTNYTTEPLVDDQGNPIGPGFYFLKVESPQISYGQFESRPRMLLAVSPYNVIVKRGRGEAMVWVTDLASGAPVSDLPVSILTFDNEPVTGSTAADGTFTGAIPQSKEPWRPTSALVGTNDQPGWGSTAQIGVSPWELGIPAEYATQQYRMHMYTDRPLYRAGDTVYFRAVVRDDNDANYTSVPGLNVTVSINDYTGQFSFKQDYVTDAYGTVYGEAVLPADAPLGGYSIEARISEQDAAWNNFLVAAFRTPEFQVRASADPTSVIINQPATATAEASYFFGGPVRNADVHWSVYSGPYTFTYDDGQNWSFSDIDPGYNPWPWLGGFGPVDPRWSPIYAEGDAATDDDGQVTINLPTEINIQGVPEPVSQQRLVEFSVTDASDQEITGSTDYVVHAAGIYPGVRPENYVGQADQEQLAHFILVDASTIQPMPDQSFDIDISQVAWRTTRVVDEFGRLDFRTTLDEEPILSTTLTTGADGEAELTWTPPTAGQYLIRASATDEFGGVNRSAAFTYIAGDEFAAWPQPPNDSIDLVADRDEYRVGDTARVLIPSPFTGPATALITIERGNVLDQRVVTLTGNSETIDIPILPEYAPNVFVSASLVSPGEGDTPAGTKMGIVQLNVSPERHLLDVEMTTDPEQARPGDSVVYRINARDWQGNPAQPQFSLALVDKALLSLRPDSGPQIDQIFWGKRNLGVFTGNSLAVSLDRVDKSTGLDLGGGGGGGGAEEAAEFAVRRDFRDVAYWSPDLVANEQGEAEITIPMPDNLTTWRAQLVAADMNTSVADVRQDLLVTKPLFIRPVLPRFVVEGDQFSAGAIIQNNTGEDQTVSLTFRLTGLETDADTQVELTVPANDSTRVDLPVVVQANGEDGLPLDSATLLMAVTGGEYRDAVEMSLPVKRFSSPETFGTAGIIAPGQPRYEAITLPDNVDASQGELTVRVEPSLAAGMIEGFDFLQHYPYECTEQTVSSFLPNIYTARAMSELGIENYGLQAALDEQINSAINRLTLAQDASGGWSWCQGIDEPAQPYTSAYALFGLVTARDAGYQVDDKVLADAARYLSSQLKSPDQLKGEALNQQAFFVYVLDQYASSAGTELPLAETQALWPERERMAQYAQAYLALTLHNQREAAETADQAQSLLDRLAGKAVSSATGAHWEEEAVDWLTMNTDTRSTAVILSALTAIQPDQPLGPNVVRWLMSVRQDGGWATTHETAWTLLALTDWMVASGELEGDFDWDVALNEQPLGAGSVDDANIAEPTVLRAAVGEMLVDQINALRLERTDGPGQLYYSAHLRAFQPVPEIAPTNRGIVVERKYSLAGDESGTAITGAQVGDVIDVELTIVLPNNATYLLVEDPIPAGTEPIDASLATTSRRFDAPEFESGEDAPPPPPWWYWNPATYQLKDDRVAMLATELPAGSHTFRYQLRASNPGQFNVLPVRGEMMYFPEVYGHGAGSAFTITRP